MKKAIIKKAVLLLLCTTLISCEDYLELDTPDHKIVSSNVFEDDQTALSALVGMYNQLSSVHFSGGGSSSVTVLSALSADILTLIYSTNSTYLQFEQHELLPNNFRNQDLWSSTYSIVYVTNALLEGADNSTGISEDVRRRIEGEAKFVRAFTYFYLVNLYGEVPLILTTDYLHNSLAGSDSKEVIYQQIIADLEEAIELLNPTYPTEERTVINRYAAVALLARVQLYLGNWEKAEVLSTQVIEENSSFELLENLNSVFLANSKEAIWQLSPEGRGISLTNTEEGGNFIIHPIYSFLAQFKLDTGFVESFSSEDKRLTDWVEFHEGTSFYYPEKYKIQNSTEEVTEYSMVLRLAEQYLIRAEARTMQGDIEAGISDLDEIRKRAGLTLIINEKPGIGKKELLNLIFQERKKELFTEWGHRWLDLKRTGNASVVLGASSSSWKETDVLYPIPESDLLANPNLTQNDGY